MKTDQPDLDHINPPGTTAACDNFECGVEFELEEAQSLPALCYRCCCEEEGVCPDCDCPLEDGVCVCPDCMQELE